MNTGKKFKGTFVGLVCGALFTGTSLANGCPTDRPQECSCSYTYSNGFTISSSICCPQEDACSCTTVKNKDGDVIRIRAKCLRDVGDPGGVE